MFNEISLGFHKIDGIKQHIFGFSKYSQEQKTVFSTGFTIFDSLDLLLIHILNQDKQLLLFLAKLLLISLLLYVR